MNPNHSAPHAHPVEAAATISTDAAREVGAIATQEAARFGEMARHWWQRNAASAREVAGTVRHEAVAIGDRTERYVRDEPVRSLLVAAAAGALIGVLAIWFGRRDAR